MEVDPPTHDSTQAPIEAAQGFLSINPTSTTSSDTPELPKENVYSLVCKWRSMNHELSVAESDTVGDLKTILFSLTGVPPDRMKLVGLVKGKLPGDEEEVVELGLSSGGSATTKKKEFMMVGTPEGQEHKEQVGPINTGDEPDIDYATAGTATREALKAMESIRNRRKLQETINTVQIDVMNAPRPGKKLLVLDLDGCILDTSLWKEPNFSTQMFMRPYLHDFLRLIAPYYDVCIWSQTSWRWLEQKLVELDIIGPSKRGDYPIITTIDRKPMFSVYSERKGQPFKHEVKALGILWAKFPEFYSAKNTVHIDDLSRNFAMNPKNGIKVHAYRDALSSDNVSTDVELLYCARYLLQLVGVQDVTTVDHSKFRKSKLPLPSGSEDPLKLATPPSNQSRSATAPSSSSTTNAQPPPPPPPQ